MLTVVPLTNQGQGKVTPVLESSVVFAFVPVPEISINPGPQELSKVKNPVFVQKLIIVVAEFVPQTALT